MKTEIVICMGSSCFARGNKKILEKTLEFIKTHNIADKAILKGNHCFGQCSNGPSIMINSKIYEDINEERIVELLENEFGLS